MSGGMEVEEALAATMNLAGVEEQSACGGQPAISVAMEMSGTGGL